MVRIIAEAGVNHNGRCHKAEALIDAAVRCGADAVKFQTYIPDKLEPPGNRRALLRRFCFTERTWRHLKKYTEERGAEFISTAFDVESLEFLVGKLGVKTLKIASGHLDNRPLLDAARASGCEIILSTGMADLEEVRQAIYGFKTKLTLLHCTSAYPAPPKDLNLRAMQTLAETFGCQVGYSDHTLGIVAPIAATALGASIIEKHFTLSCQDKGPDHAMSSEPAEFGAMVAAVRQTELALGDGIKKPRQSELDVMKIVEERRQWRLAQSS